MRLDDREIDNNYTLIQHKLRDHCFKMLICFVGLIDSVN